jgi:transposase-like protein
MSGTDKPLGQVYYEEVEALKASGLSNADAVREVASKHGKKENAVRGGIHQYKSRHVGTSAPAAKRSRRTATTVDDYFTTARKALEDALSLVDREVDEAEAALAAAKARYDEVVGSVKDRKADIERRLAALM